MIYFKNLFKLPGPKDLGMSDSNNAMPSSLFPNKKNEHTWESYYEYIQNTYPVKYFLASTLPTFFLDQWRTISRPLKDAHYWFVSHFVPSRRYHMLDLRQPKNGIANIDYYAYGWRDTDSLMVYALFNLLCRFVENEAHRLYIPTEEDIAKESTLKYQLDNYKEFTAIYYWWKNERLTENNEYYDKLRIWSDARHRFADNERALWEELNTIETRNKDKLDEMLIRLIKIRGCLWT